MNPRKRRWLVILAVIVLAGGPALVFGRRNQQDYLPDLILLRQEEQNGTNVAVFRFKAPKYGSSELEAMSTRNTSTGEQRKPCLLPGESNLLGEPLESHSAQGTNYVFIPPFFAVTGVEPEFAILPPPDAVWRLRCEASIAHPIDISSWIRELPSTVKSCWHAASLRPLRSRRWVTETVILQSEPITNDVSPPNQTSVK